MSKMTNLTDAGVSDLGQNDGQKSREDVGRQSDSRVRRTRAPRGRRAETRCSPTLTLEVAAREWMWLYDYRHGMSLAEIAGYEGLSIERVWAGVERAAAHESKLSKDDLVENFKSFRENDMGFRLIPLFPIGAFTPQATCSHRDSIEKGSRLCCMVCHASGMDDHPGLQRDPKTDPSPEPQPALPADPVVQIGPGKLEETRKQRRRRQFVEAAMV